MEFPAFTFGGEEEVIERSEAEGAAWLASWQATGALPAGALRPIAAGELVIVEHGTLDPFTPHWRLFGVGFALASIGDTGLDDCALATPWGALAACARLRKPNTIETVPRRVRALLAQWDALATLRYIGRARALPAVVVFPAFNQPAIGLDELASELFEGPLAMWGPALGPTRVRLELALDAMASATPELAREKVSERMIALARSNHRVQGKLDDAQIAAHLDTLDLAELAPGVTGDLLVVLYDLLRGDVPRRYR